MGRGTYPVRPVSPAACSTYVVGICQYCVYSLRTRCSVAVVEPPGRSLAHAARLRLRLKLSSRCSRPTSMEHG